MYLDNLSIDEFWEERIIDPLKKMGRDIGMSITDSANNISDKYLNWLDESRYWRTNLVSVLIRSKADIDMGSKVREIAKILIKHLPNFEKTYEDNTKYTYRLSEFVSAFDERLKGMMQQYAVEFSINKKATPDISKLNVYKLFEIGGIDQQIYELNTKISDLLDDIIFRSQRWAEYVEQVDEKCAADVELYNLVTQVKYWCEEIRDWWDLMEEKENDDDNE